MKSQHESDLNNPKERLAWAFRGLGYNGFPMAIPDPIKEEWSEHLSKCGFIHVSQVADHIDLESLGIKGQEIHYQPPVRGQDHAMNLSGSWVSVDTPIQAPIIPTASLMTPAEKQKMLDEFREEGLLD